MTRLAAGKTFHSHLGGLPHADLLGLPEGSWVTTAKGHRLLALRPTLADLVLQMPRATQVIYPKDLGAILMYGDIFPGARVLEAGLGSGALTLALLRAVGERGSVVSYELRPEVIERALANIRGALGETANLTVRLSDVYQEVAERDVDRMVSDVPEPWQIVPHACQVLVPGGVFLAFLPTVLQVHRLVASLKASGAFQLTETREVLVRSWHVTEESMRPDHRMVAHTGFLVTARKAAPRPAAPEAREEDKELQASEGQEQEVP